MPAPYTPIRGNLFYFGYAKQPAGGWVASTGAAVPTGVWRWLDGSDANPDAKFVTEMEGDLSPEVSLMYKGSQVWKVLVKEYARPVTLGIALQAHNGSGSDAYVAPSKSTTLSAAIAAGANSFSSTASLGNAGNAYIGFTTSATNSGAEFKQVNLASQAGTGPYTYSLVAGQSFAKSHAAGDTVQTSATHAFTRQFFAYDFYSLEVAVGEGVMPQQVFRLRNAVCTDLDMQMDKGKVISVTHTWYAVLDSMPAATFNHGSLPLEIAAPFKFDMAAGTWSLDGATTGNALKITKLQITSKDSSFDPLAFQDESIAPDFFMLGNRSLDVKAQTVFNGWAQYNETFFGATTVSATTQDSALTGFGSLAATWSIDGFNTFAINLPYLGYKPIALKPVLKGGPLTMPMDLIALKPPSGGSPITATLTNSQAAAY